MEQIEEASPWSPKALGEPNFNDDLSTSAKKYVVRNIDTEHVSNAVKKKNTNSYAYDFSKF